MPKTAAAVQELGYARPETLDDTVLERLCDHLDEDLPGAVGYIEQAAMRAQTAGSFAYLSCSPSDMDSKAAWEQLVGYLARLFASPFGAIVKERMRRQHGVSVAFINCCIVAAQPGDIDEDELWCLQSRMQLTPDC